MADTKKPFIVKHDGIWDENFGDPSVSVLNFSGGKQSSALLWMILLGEIEMPGKVLVLNADPGMENKYTYQYVEMMRRKCEEKGVPFITAPGPNLYQDLVGFKASGKTRLDLPGYFTKSPEGKKGKLLQRCTAEYKIAPMDRALRRYIRENKLGLKAASVHKWIGFSANEVHRIKPPSQKYVAFRYPLVEMGMTNSDVEDYLRSRNLPVPPRSVCSACFANTAGFMARMKRERPDDYEMALAVDDAIRDLTQAGVREEVYVLRDIIPIRDAVEIEELVKYDEVEYSDVCESGYCFV